MALRRAYLEDYGQTLPLHTQPRPSDVGTIGMTGHRSLRHPSFQKHFSNTPYRMIQQDQYRPVAPIRPVGPTYLYPLP